MDQSSDASTVAIIGASGFVGRRLIELLAAEGKLRPIAITRRPGNLAVEQRTCDATDPAAVTAALDGVSCAVNCVAGDAATLIAATRNICAAAGARRVVHLSSMAVYGNAVGLIDESHTLMSDGGWYAEAKIDCEKAATAADAVILRPGCIHGPRSESWTARIGRLLRQRRIGDLGAAGDGICNLVHVDDVVSAIRIALSRPGIAGRAFNIGDPDPGTWNDYFIRFAIAIGAVPVKRIATRTLKLDSKLFAPPLKIAQILASRVARAHLVADPLPSSLLSLWRQEIQLDHRNADTGLGFARMTPNAAIADAASWFVAQT